MVPMTCYINYGLLNIHSVENHTAQTLHRDGGLLVPELPRLQNDDPLALMCSPWIYSFSIAAEELQPILINGRDYHLR